MKLIKKKIKVLFICVYNSARSQMAEAFLNQFAMELAMKDAQFFLGQ